MSAERRRWRPSLRLRLTITGTVLAAAAFTVGGLLLVSIYRQTLIGDTERQLSGTAYEVLSGVGQADLPTPIPMPTAAGVPRRQILDSADRVITGDPASIQPPPILTVAPGGTSRTLVATDPGYLPAHHVYVLAVARVTPAGRRTVVIAGSLDPAVERADQAALLAGYAGAGSLAVVAALTWLLTGRALRPVEQLRSQVIAITASGDLSRRVPHPSWLDEIGRLAGTLKRDAAGARDGGPAATPVHRRRRP